MNHDIRRPLPVWSGDGDGSEIAESLNLLARRIELIGRELPEVVGGPGIFVKTELGRVLIRSAVRQVGGGALPALQFSVTLTKDADDWKSTTEGGYVDGAYAGKTIHAAAAGDHIYVVATYATAYDDIPSSVGIARAESFPRSHDTRWIIPVARIISDEGVLRVAQITTGPQNSARHRQPKSFEVTREADTLRIAAGWITALTNPSDSWSLNLKFDSVTVQPEDGTLLLPVSVVGGAADGGAPFVVTVGAPYFGEVANTNRGLFVGLPAVSVYAPSSPDSCGDTVEVVGLLSNSTPAPTCTFVIPLAEIDAGGNPCGETPWRITQRQCGDIMLPLATQWGMPSAV